MGLVWNLDVSNCAIPFTHRAIRANSLSLEWPCYSSSCASFSACLSERFIQRKLDASLLAGVNGPHWEDIPRILGQLQRALQTARIVKFVVSLSTGRSSKFPGGICGRSVAKPLLSC